MVGRFEGPQDFFSAALEIAIQECRANTPLHGSSERARISNLVSALHRAGLGTHVSRAPGPDSSFAVRCRLGTHLKLSRKAGRPG